MSNEFAYLQLARRLLGLGVMKRASPFLSIGDISMLVGIAMALCVALLWSSGAH